MQIQPELKSVLKRLRLSGILATLPDRWAYARQEKLDYPQFLELVLSDEVERRDHKNLANRLREAGFEEECSLERFDGENPWVKDREKPQASNFRLKSRYWTEWTETSTLVN